MNYGRSFNHGQNFFLFIRSQSLGVSLGCEVASSKWKKDAEQNRFSVIGCSRFEYNIYSNGIFNLLQFVPVIPTPFSFCALNFLLTTKKMQSTFLLQ